MTAATLTAPPMTAARTAWLRALPEPTLPRGGGNSWVTGAKGTAIQHGIGGGVGPAVGTKQGGSMSVPQPHEPSSLVA